MAGYTVSSVTTGKYARQISVAASGPQGAAGPKGDKGDAGVSGGLSASYKFLNTYSAQNPGNGYIAFNTQSIFSATSLYISELDALTDPQTGLLDVTISSSNGYKSVITVQDSINTRKFSRYYVLSGVSANGWRTLSISYIDGTALSWGYNDRLTLLVSPIGDAGEVGATGPQGAPGVGVPSGGTSGQILRKTSENDYATEWVDPNQVESVSVRELTDVVLTDLGNAQVLVFDDQHNIWYNKPILDLDISVSQISGTIDGGTATN